MTATDYRRDIRFKLNDAEAAQLDRDRALIQRIYGQLPYKYLVLSAVHLWASRIRAGEHSESDTGETK